jgi:hypothetical protein
MSPKNHDFWNTVHEDRCASAAERVYFSTLAIHVAALAGAFVFFDSKMPFFVIFTIALSFMAYGEWLLFLCLRRRQWR